MGVNRMGVTSRTIRRLPKFAGWDLGQFNLSHDRKSLCPTKRAVRLYSTMNRLARRNGFVASNGITELNQPMSSPTKSLR